MACDHAVNAHSVSVPQFLHEDFDEFRHLIEDANRLGIGRPPPPVSRVTIELPSPSASTATLISTLRWTTSPPEVVLLHGARLNAHSWDSMLLTLGRPALAIDLPGHGRSSWREDADYRPSTMAPSIIETIRRECSSPFILVGHSRGGLTAILVAAALQHLVAGLIIVDISPGRRPTKEVSPGFGDPLRQESFASRDEVVDYAIASGMGRSRKSLEHGVLFNTRIRADGRVVFAHHLAQLPPPVYNHSEADEQWSALTRLRAPSVLVTGSRGILLPAELDEFRQQSPRTTRVVLETGHNVHRDAPAELAAVIENLARRRPQSDSGSTG